MKKTLAFFLLITGINFAQNYCLNFNGADDYVTINSNFGVGTNSITVECWVFIPSTSEQGTFVNIGDAGVGYGIGVGGGVNHNFDAPGNELVVIYNMRRWIPTGVNMGTGWHHVAFTVGAQGEANIYLDGKTVHTETGSQVAPTIPTNTTYIGATETDIRIFSNGKIDEVRIWSKVRTQGEITRNMFSEAQGNELNLVAYYKMNDGSGMTLTSNLTSGGANGTITGATWQTSGAFEGPGQALNFDGTNDYVSCGDINAIDGLGTITVSAWVKWGGTAGAMNTTFEICRKELVYTLGAGWDAGKAKFWIYPSSGTGWVNSGPSITRIDDGNWHYIVGVYDNSNIILYVDGKQESINNVGSLTLNSNSNIVTIGTLFGYGYYWNGLIDEVRIWSVAKSAFQIRTDMTRTLSGNESGLIAYYRFDQKDGTTLYDMTPNGNNGTLTNMDNSDWVTSSAFTTWIGSESTDWNNSANWSGNSVPTDYTGNLGIYSYTNGNDLSTNTYGAVIGVNNMVVATSSTFNLPSTVGIIGNLIIESNMNAGSFNINFGNTGHLIEDAGVVTGTSALITFGKDYGGTPLNSENAGGLGLILNCGDSPGYVMVYRGFEQSPGSITNSIQRYYNFNIQYGQAVDIIMPYLDSEVTGLESNLGFYQCVDNLEGGPYNWDQENSVVINHTSNTITLSDFLTTGSITYRFTAADDPSLLPVELTSFNARVLNNTVILNWQTATEVNNYGFEIERSVISNAVRNLSWQKIGFVNGNGNSNSPKNYSFVDDNVSAGKYSYRLKQIDNDGQYEYSKTIEVDMNGIKKFELSQNYPNPFNPSTTIKFNLPEAGMVKLTLYNILGQEIRWLVNEFKESGTHTINFDASELNSGMYIYKIESGSFVQTRKMTLVK